jgi:hypothetical protein
MGVGSIRRPIALSPVVKHVALTGGMVVFALLLFRGTAADGGRQSRAWLDLLPSTDTSAGRVAGIYWSAQAMDSAQTHAVRDRLQRVRRRMDHHLDVAVYFQSRYYAALVNASVFALVATILGLVVSRKGWDDAHPLLLNALLVAVALAAFYLGFPAMFQQEANAEANLRQYVAYSALDRRISTYLDTGVLPPSGASRLDSVLTKIDSALVAHSDIIVGLDIGGLPTAAQVRNLLGEVAPVGQN